MKTTILTGLRSNNNLTIGNYLGAILPMVDMAKSRAGQYQINFFVPDLHSFTTPIDHSELYKQTINNLRSFAAAGLPLDNPDVFIYRQSFVPAHSELTWILDCFTGVGQLSRMTQFKEKAREKSKNLVAILDDVLNSHFSEQLTGLPGDINKIQEIKRSLNELKTQLVDATILDEGGVGLFNYPVLMAADILLYNASFVPVGDDQTQHLEFTRDLAQRMNSRFGDLFTVPESVQKQHDFFGKDQGLRIRDLSDPTKKMSKSDETGKGVLFLSDKPKLAAKKIMDATTDSLNEINFNFKAQPGISNLLQILALLGKQSQQAVNQKYKGQTSYGGLKNEVARVVGEFLADFSKRYDQIDEAQILAKLERDEAAMRKQANQTLLKVQQAVGLRSKN